MNILHIFATLPIGGAEEHLRTVLGNIDSERFNSVVCCIGEKGSIGEEIEASGVEVITLGRMKKKGFDVSIPGRIKALIKDRSIDLVHTQLYHANMYGRIAAVLAGVPV
ncbi:MAG: glycosyltransferase, partial [bacterium]|nr:glycosyltransferase [bacterium]